MASTSSSRRRIVRRTVVALAVIVLLLNVYVVSYFALHWAFTKGYPAISPRSRVFRPLEWYMFEGDHPGHVELRAFWFWSVHPGEESLSDFIEYEFERERLYVEDPAPTE